MQIQLSDHFSLKRLIRFTLPSVCMMVFTSIYLVIDGYFVSNFVGKGALAAVNMVYPIIMVISSIGFMFGSGGSALVAATLGEGDEERARRNFTLLFLFPSAMALAIAIPAFLFLPQILSFLGAEGRLLEDSITYGRILLTTVFLFVVQMEAQVFFVTAERPKLGLVNSILGFGTNIILDGLFCAVFRWGITGAAAATAISQAIGGIIPLLYFSFAKGNRLHFTRTEFEFRAVSKSAGNGLSELLSNISSSIVAMLFNGRLLYYAGEDGVAAYSVLMYVNMVFLSLFLGFSSGSGPLISFNYGSGNTKELKGLFHKLLIIILSSSVAMLALSLILSHPLSSLFVGYDRKLLEMTERGFGIYSFSFLFAGLNIFASSFFTALNDGKVSAIISFLRAFLFQVISVLVLPYFLGIDGIWLSIVATEVLTLFFSLYFLVTRKKDYDY